MNRPKSFSEIVGHNYLIQYLQEHLTKGTLPHFLILEGPEGLGKTSIADLIALSLVYGVGDSEEKTKAYNNVVLKKQSNDYIKKYELSVEGGKDVAKDVRAEMHNTFNLGRPKVIICDECHGLSEAAQDVFLSDTEYISKDVYLIMLTTEVEKLKASLRSRAVPIRLSPLKHSDMVTVLKREVAQRGLTIQNEDITLGLIADWAECKPRTGLNILNAFSKGSTISMNVIRELIGYMEVSDVLPLLSSLAGSMTFGLSFISEMKIDSNFVSIVVECLKVKSGAGSYKLQMNEVSNVRDQLNNVTVEQLMKFLHGITSVPKLTKSAIINAYIGAHSQFKTIVQPDTSSTLEIEKSQKAEIETDIAVTKNTQAPSFSELLKNSDIIEG